MKLIIAGGRLFDDYELLESTIQANYDWGVMEIVCGEARGADALGRRFGENWFLKVHSFPANWDMYGKSAGYRRNVDMADFADGLLAFWDGKSKGTGHMIDLAKKKGIAVEVVQYGESL
jgi:hypothetical protein